MHNKISISPWLHAQFLIQSMKEISNCKILQCNYDSLGNNSKTHEISDFTILTTNIPKSMAPHLLSACLSLSFSLFLSLIFTLLLPFVYSHKQTGRCVVGCWRVQTWSSLRGRWRLRWEETEGSPPVFSWDFQPFALPPLSTALRTLGQTLQCSANTTQPNTHSGQDRGWSLEDRRAGAS